MISRLELALQMVERGLPVFPVGVNSKRPACESWKKDATLDVEKVKKIFEENPDLNYGIAVPDNMVVIDIDVKNGKRGDLTINELQGNEDLSDWITDGSSFTVLSPNNGKHIFLSVEQNVTNGHTFGKDKGVDVKGSRKGYVLGAGSEIDGKSYEIESDVEIKPAPPWVASRLRLATSTKEKAETEVIEGLELDTADSLERGKKFVRAREVSIEGLGGNNHLYETCCMLKDYGISENKCLRLLTSPIMENGKSWNDSCVPPFPEEQLAQTVNNAYRYGVNAVGAGSSPLDAYIKTKKDGVNMEEVPDNLGADFVFETAEEAMQKVKDIEKQGLDALFYQGTSLLDRNETREYVIDNFLIAHGFTGLLAKRSTGKTIILTDMALRIACDMDWHDKDTAKDYCCIYLCGEDDLGLQEHINAWIKKHGVSPQADRFAVMAGIVDLMNFEEVRKWTQFLKEHYKGRKVVLFFDTFQRATSAGGQNDDKDMQLAIHHIEVMAKALKGPAVVSFHPPKHDASVVLGSSVIENSSTGIWVLDNSAEGKKLKVTRIKGPGEGDHTSFRFDIVGIEKYNQHGKERTGIVPSKVGSSTQMDTAESKQKRQNVNQAWALAVKKVIDSINEMPAEGRPEPNMSFVCDTIVERKDEEDFLFLAEIGETNLSKSTVTRRLKSIFGPGNYPIEIPDSNYGILLKKKKFQVVEIPTPDDA